MGELTTVIRASTKQKFTSLQTVIPTNIVKHWGLEEGDKLDWDWEVKDGKMKIVVDMVKINKK